MQKSAMVIGCYGQDGRLMCRLLKRKGYHVVGVYNNTEPPAPYKYKNIDYATSVAYLRNDWEYKNLIRYNQVDEIYNFSGVTDVFDPYDNPSRVFEQNGLLPVTIMQAIVDNNLQDKMKFFQASSSLVFGRNKNYANNEDSPRSPMYPYGAAKAFADHMVNEFRHKYGLFACSGIFYNHESPYRRDGFFTKKIAKRAVEIKRGIKPNSPVILPNTNTGRDYSYAGDFMEAVYLMMQRDTPKDYVIGSGHLTTLAEFTSYCFQSVGLSPREYEIRYESKSETSGPPNTVADIREIHKDLGWSPKTPIRDLAYMMTRFEMLKKP